MCNIHLARLATLPKVFSMMYSVFACFPLERVTSIIVLSDLLTSKLVCIKQCFVVGTPHISARYSFLNFFSSSA
ncbi:hypothetical protein ANAPH2_01279 [Anaplasma phagocytophilum]|nr:hypothetical protein ANAPH2_01279 [Anaplasma phagocytophilum]